MNSAPVINFAFACTATGDFTKYKVQSTVYLEGRGSKRTKETTDKTSALDAVHWLSTRHNQNV